MSGNTEGPFGHLIKRWQMVADSSVEPLAQVVGFWSVRLAMTE
jgi:hypothetical protein